MDVTQRLFTFEVMPANATSLEEDDVIMSCEASSQAVVATRGEIVRGTVLPAYGRSRATKATYGRGHSYGTQGNTTYAIQHILSVYDHRSLYQTYTISSLTIPNSMMCDFSSFRSSGDSITTRDPTSIAQKRDNMYDRTISKREVSLKLQYVAFSIWYFVTIIHSSVYPGEKKHHHHSTGEIVAHQSGANITGAILKCSATKLKL
jgi:hypothetical protein